jgi:hypothetical protein
VDFDERKIDEAVLALLYLTLHDGNRAWKNIDFAALDRLQEQDFLSGTVTRAKSVVFTEKGLRAAELQAAKQFAKK